MATIKSGLKFAVVSAVASGVLVTAAPTYAATNTAAGAAAAAVETASSTSRAASPAATKKYVWDALRRAGATRAGAAAIMGNLYMESKVNPRAVEEGTGVGYGIAQWSFERRKNLRVYARKNKIPMSSIETQTRFLLKEFIEMKRSDGKNWLTWMKDVKEVRKGTLQFSKEFLRPNPEFAHNGLRIKYAKQFYKTYG